jgi:CRP-like cAMP-binding protein
MAEQDRARAQQLMYGIAILQGVEGMKLFEQVANFVTLFEGDRLTERVLKDNLVFVGEGRLARSIENNDGWYETLDVVKDGSWVNESVMLPGSKIRLSVEVLTEQATIILLPLRKMNSLLEGNLKLWQNIFLHVLRQMEKYQKLWLMA